MEIGKNTSFPILQIREDNGESRIKYICNTKRNGLKVIEGSTYNEAQFQNSCKFLVNSLERDFTKGKFQGKL